MALMFERVVEGDTDAVIDFLCASEWPFHGVRRLTVATASTVNVSEDGIESFWIREDELVVGLVRLLDLDDVEDGSPLFDLRIAHEHRGRGFGTAAVKWLSGHLFSTYPTLHRIEANTRNDNAAMMAVLDRNGYRLEGVLREAWKSDDGSRHDTMIYAILRHEWPVR